MGESITFALDKLTVYCYNNVMSEKQYTIDDLCELTGFSRRTVRYYVQEGLVDPPAGRGRGGFYYDSQLEQLRQIKALQERGLKLAAIAEILKDKKEESVPEKPSLEREIWIKHSITDGLELHFSRELENREGKRIAEIIRVVRSIIESGGNDNE